MALHVETSVPCGNAARVEIVDGPAAAVAFDAHPHGGPETLWFRFRLVSDAPPPPGATVRLILKNAHNLLGGGDVARFRPTVRADGGDWERLGGGQAMTLDDGRVCAEWTLPYPHRTADVALCYPYDLRDVEALLADTDGYWRADEIGVSQGGRGLVRLSNDRGAPSSTRAGVYLVARQHSGETPGSWVLDGMLRRFAECGTEAPLVWAVPLSNIDGVEGGDYGKDNFPIDLNRAWGHPPMRHEALVLQRDMHRWKGRCRPLLGLDLHAPGGTEAKGAYFFLPKPDYAGDFAAPSRALAEAFSEALTPRLAAPDPLRLATYASRWELPTFTRFCCESLAIPSLSMETPYAMAGETLLTRELYREIGSRLADVLCQAARG